MLVQVAYISTNFCYLVSKSPTAKISWQGYVVFQVEIPILLMADMLSMISIVLVLVLVLYLISKDLCYTR